jgi:formylglycine-generating enzyme required for sulfatase activity
VKETGHDADSDVYRLIDNLEDLEKHRQQTGLNPPDDIIDRETPYYGKLDGWRDARFEQTDRHPALGMNLRDALDFCAWLTKHERTSGTISDEFEFTLPSDYEWSIAAGLKEQPRDAAPRDRHRASLLAELGSPARFPFGELTAAPTTFGNYRGDADGFDHSSPVGSFPPNAFGLFDLGGNASEWCRDLYDDTMMFGALRGGNWRTSPDALVEVASSHRNTPKWSKPDRRNEHFGFRCVLRPVTKAGAEAEK